MTSDARASLATAELAHELQARRVGPVRVLQRDHERRVRRRVRRSSARTHRGGPGETLRARESSTSSSGAGRSPRSRAKYGIAPSVDTAPTECCRAYRRGRPGAPNCNDPAQQFGVRPVREARPVRETPCFGAHENPSALGVFAYRPPRAATSRPRAHPSPERTPPAPPELRPSSRGDRRPAPAYPPTSATFVRSRPQRRARSPTSRHASTGSLLPFQVELTDGRRTRIARPSAGR